MQSVWATEEDHRLARAVYLASTQQPCQPDAARGDLPSHLRQGSCRDSCDWSLVARSMPGRNARQCRERYLTHIDVGVNRAPWTAPEDAIIVQAQARFGNRWSAIAPLLTGRTANAIKNRFNGSILPRLKYVAGHLHRRRKSGVEGMTLSTICKANPPKPIYRECDRRMVCANNHACQDGKPAFEALKSETATAPVSKFHKLPTDAEALNQGLLGAAQRTDDQSAMPFRTEARHQVVDVAACHHCKNDLEVHMHTLSGELQDARISFSQNQPSSPDFGPAASFGSTSALVDLQESESSDSDFFEFDLEGLPVFDPLEA